MGDNDDGGGNKTCLWELFSFSGGRFRIHCSITRRKNGQLIKVAGEFIRSVVATNHSLKKFGSFRFADHDDFTKK